MESTAARLDAGAATAAQAALEGGDDLKAIYMMSPQEINVAASSHPKLQISETWECVKETKSSQPLKSHYEAALQVHRMTGGGQKLPSVQSGPIATAFNPGRHVMVIAGRPVMVLGIETKTHS